MVDRTLDADIRRGLDRMEGGWPHCCPVCCTFRQPHGWAHAPLALTADNTWYCHPERHEARAQRFA